MDTSNRQQAEVGIETGKDKAATGTNLEKVAIVANLKKIGCDELSPKEWVDLIKITLHHAKPFLKYIPLFLPVGEKRLKHFFISHSYSLRGIYVGGNWLDGEFLFSEPVDATLAALVTTKAIVVCEASHPTDRELSKKVMLTSQGVFVLVYCKRRLGDRQAFTTGKPILYEAIIIHDDLPLETLIAEYPQVGPDSLFAISSALENTYAQKMADLENLGRVSKHLRSIRDNLDFAHGHYLNKYPHGVSDGSDKIIEQMRA